MILRPTLQGFDVPDEACRMQINVNDFVALFTLNEIGEAGTIQHINSSYSSHHHNNHNHNVHNHHNGQHSYFYYTTCLPERQSDIHKQNN